MAGITIGVVALALLLICSIMFCIVWAWSPGKIAPHDDERGLSEIVRVDIGGLEQGMIIKSQNVDNPVLLFLHGGPGNPQYVLFNDIGLEEYFTVCWWDQRGSGMSYSGDLEPESITLDQMISDTVEVTDYLRNRFGKDKIYLMGLSFGSFLGINVAARHPDLFEAYMGISQVTSQLESEKLGYQSMLSVAEASGDSKSIKNLKQHHLDGPETITTDYLMLRSKTMEKQGTGVFHDSRSTFDYAIMPLLRAREYTLSDKYGFIAGSLFMLKTPANSAQFSTNIMETITTIEVPVFFFHGVHDRVASYDLSRQYFDMLTAPRKEFFSFEHSAHSPHMEEPQRLVELIREHILGL